MPPTLLFSVFVGTNFKVKCYKKSSIIQVRHLINGFTLKLELYSQLGQVMDYVSNTNPNLNDELHSLEKQLTDLCNHEDVDKDLKYRLTFFASQLRLSIEKVHGIHVSPMKLINII